MDESCNPDFIAFLQKQMTQARAEFREAVCALETFEQSNGRLVYWGEWEKQDRQLSEKAHQAYMAYKHAWVRWYAAVNGYNITRRVQKDTPAFAAATPARFLIDRIRLDTRYR